jgi:hypothetical protein
MYRPDVTISMVSRAISEAFFRLGYMQVPPCDVKVTPQAAWWFGDHHGQEGDPMPIHDWKPECDWLFHDHNQA